jgi:tellurite resistance protein TehA-like permease
MTLKTTLQLITWLWLIPIVFNYIIYRLLISDLLPNSWASQELKSLRLDESRKRSPAYFKYLPGFSLFMAILIILAIIGDCIVMIRSRINDQDKWDEDE